VRFVINVFITEKRMKICGLQIIEFKFKMNYNQILNIYFKGKVLRQ